MKLPTIAQARAALPRFRKGIVTVLTFAAAAVSAGLLHGEVLTVTELILSAATAAGVITVPNKPKETST